MSSIFSPGSNTQLSIVDRDSASSERAEYVDAYFRDIFTKLPRNTQRAYISDFNDFAIFCQSEGIESFNDDFSHNEHAIKRYVEELCKSPLAYRTIKRRLSALSKFLGIAKLPNPIIQSVYLRDFVRLSLIENRKFQLSHNQAVPLTIDLLDEINNKIIPDTLLEMRDLTIMNLMFDALLRADELVRVCVEHISRRNNALLVVTSKSDQSGKGSHRFISTSTINMVDEYIAEANFDTKLQSERLTDDTRRINKGILFRRVSNRGHALLPFDEQPNTHYHSAAHSPVYDPALQSILDYSSVYRIWKRIAARAGIKENITPHSGRVGGAVSLAENGATLPELQLAGGWQSPEMPGHYTQQANVKRGGMAKLSEKFKR